jgi:hypothetical protein
MATKKKTPAEPAKAASKQQPKTGKFAALKSTLSAKGAKTDVSYESLRRWNFILAGLHALQGALVLALSTTALFPVTTNFLAVDPLQSAAQDQTVLTAGSQHLADVNLAYLVAAFFFMSAIAHMVVATVYRKRYEAGLAEGINRVRWYEYAFSASTMMVAIGMLVGVQDLSLLVALFGLTAVMNLCGLVMEVHNRPGKPVNWLSYVVGSIAGVLPWVIIALYLWSGATYGSQAPAFVYWIFVSIFVFFMSFAVNMVLQYRRTGKWASYLYGEKVYMMLSLVAKSLLAWQVFAGALRP